MEKTLEQRIAELNRDLALKNAYLAVKITFPPGNKIPEDVREEVTQKIRELATSLAEKQEITQASAAGQFTAEEVEILKSVVETIKTKKSTQVKLTNGTQSVPVTLPAETTVPRVSEAPNAPRVNIHQPQSQDVGFRKAVLLSLENTPKAMRNKMGANEEVYVKSVKGDKAFIQNAHGQGGFVPLEDLEMKD